MPVLTKLGKRRSPGPFTLPRPHQDCLGDRHPEREGSWVLGHWAEKAVSFVFLPVAHRAWSHALHRGEHKDGPRSSSDLFPCQGTTPGGFPPPQEQAHAVGTGECSGNEEREPATVASTLPLGACPPHAPPRT